MKFLAKPFVMALLLAGCQSYQPLPELSPESFPPGESVEIKSVSDAQLVARCFNPGINRVRLEALHADKRADATGWWPDPDFANNLTRILNNPKHPWVANIGVMFTIPVNGALEFDRQAADFYAEAQRFQVSDAERRLDVSVATALAAWLETEANWKSSDALVVQTDALAKQAQHLYTTGEMRAADVQAVQSALYAAIDQQAEDAEAYAEAQAQLIKLLGLTPGTPLTVEAALGTFEKLPAIMPEQLFQHTAVKARLATYRESEAKLRAELRRQYPDIKIGPYIDHEDGGWRPGAMFAMTLPLWNRNRLGIAEARMSHALAYDDTRTLYLELLLDAEAQMRRYKLQRENLTRLEGISHEKDVAADSARKLASAGEISLTALTDAENAAAQAGRKYRRAHAALLQTYAQLSYLNEVPQ